jgi:hypothetical protein
MKRSYESLLFCFVLLMTILSTAVSIGEQPGWSSSVIARGEERQQIRATPIEQRPYRPLHVYGNTVRRIHYRGTPLPTVGETVALPARVIGTR